MRACVSAATLERARVLAFARAPAAVRVRVLLPALVLAALATGCKRGHESPGETDAVVSAETGAAPSAGAAVGHAANAAEVLARVGDRVITLGDYEAALEHMDQFDRLRYQAPERRKELLHEMIDVMLLADEARERGYDKDPLAVQEVREILRDAVRKKVRQGATAPNDIPAAEVAAYYQAHKTDFHDPERRRVSAIVLASAAQASLAEDAAAKAGKDGPAWGDLVRTRSIDPQAKANAPLDLAGDLGFVNPPGDPHPPNPRIPEEVRAAVFEIEHVGDVLPRVVKATAADGRSLFYVVKLGAKSDAHDRSLQDVERSLRVKLAEDKADQAEADLMARLRKQYPVQVDESALGQVRVP
jgi:peptidyl-prolyl cis-trans isomerase C